MTKIAIVVFDYSHLKLGGAMTGSKNMLAALKAYGQDVELVAINSSRTYKHPWPGADHYYKWEDLKWVSALESYDKVIWFNCSEIHRAPDPNYTTRSKTFFYYLSSQDEDKHFFFFHDEYECDGYMFASMKNMQISDKMIFNSKHNLEAFRENFKVDGTWFVLVPQPVQIQKESFWNRSKSVIYFGRVNDAQKQVLSLVNNYGDCVVYGRMTDDKLTPILGDKYKGLVKGSAEDYLQRHKYSWNLIKGDPKRLGKYFTCTTDTYKYPFVRRLEIGTMESIRCGTIPILHPDTIPDFYKKSDFKVVFDHQDKSINLAKEIESVNEYMTPDQHFYSFLGANAILDSVLEQSVINLLKLLGIQ